MSQMSPNSPVAEPEKATDHSAGLPALDGTALGLQAQADEHDPLADLYKMSRTAGLGSGDYVAVNPVAVTSLIFGIAAALVIVDSLFVVVPLVGLILGIIGWRQVRGSNGTQTGAVMAGGAILLSLLFLGGKVGKGGVDWIRIRADKQEISTLIGNLGKDLSDIDPVNPANAQAHLDDAYNQFDEAFRSRVPRERFGLLWTESRRSPFFGPLESLQSNGLLKFDPDARSGDMVCTSIAIAGFKRGEAPRWTIIFRQLNGKWFVDDMPDVFPAAAPPQQPRR